MAKKLNREHDNKSYYGEDLRNADFRNSILNNTNFYGANLENADFTGSIFKGTLMKNANVEGAIFDNTSIIEGEEKGLPDELVKKAKKMTWDDWDKIYYDGMDDSLLEDEEDEIEIVRMTIPMWAAQSGAYSADDVAEEIGSGYFVLEEGWESNEAIFVDDDAGMRVIVETPDGFTIGDAVEGNSELLIYADDYITGEYMRTNPAKSSVPKTIGLLAGGAILGWFLKDRLD